MVLCDQYKMLTEGSSVLDNRGGFVYLTWRLGVVFTGFFCAFAHVFTCVWPVNLV